MSYLWNEEYQKLNDSEKDEFSKVVSLLLFKTFILRYKLDPKGKSIKHNPHYSFIERNASLIKEYLRVSGFGFVKDSHEGVIQLVNKYNANHERLDKIPTILLYTLRLVYSEEREKVSLRNEVITTVCNIVEKLKNIGVYDKKPNDKSWEEAFKKLKHFNIVDKLDGSWNSPDTQLIIYPSVIFVATDERVNEIYDYVKSNNLINEDNDEAEDDEQQENED